MQILAKHLSCALEQYCKTYSLTLACIQFHLTLNEIFKDISNFVLIIVQCYVIECKLI